MLWDSKKESLNNMKSSESASDIPDRTIALVGMMGAGKSVVGRRLASQLKLPFVDSDTEIEKAAGMTITEFFDHKGEAEFRQGERRVIARLLEGGRCVLSTGGGAFIDDGTRALMRKKSDFHLAESGRGCFAGTRAAA
jgi:shikimate kinase